MRNSIKTLGGIRKAILALIIGVASTVSQAATQTIFYHLDALGSPIVATDEGGNLLWREEYRPYGDKIQKDPVSTINSRAFTGHPHDDTTGLTYAGARHYDPVVGRFMGVDPAPFAENNIQSFNRYAYGNNNPYKYVDPDGNSPILLVPIIAVGVGLFTLSDYANAPAPTEAPVTMSSVERMQAVQGALSNRNLLSPGLGVVRQGSDDTKGSRKKVEPVKDAAGPHTTWKTDPRTGEITRHETWQPNVRNPSGWDKVQSTDIRGRPHYNKQTGESIPTPHTQGKDIPGGVRPATPAEIPKGYGR